MKAFTFSAPKVPDRKIIVATSTTIKVAFRNIVFIIAKRIIDRPEIFTFDFFIGIKIWIKTFAFLCNAK